MIHKLAALDSIFLVDRTPNAINAIGPERIAKSALALVVGFEKVKQESDWKNTGGKKNFKSKIHWESVKRFDPSYQEEDKLFTSRKVEDEQRQEMERTANWLKAKSKVETYAKDQ